MRYVDLEKHSGKIFVVPYRRKGGEFWAPLPDDQKVIISDNSNAQQVGVAAKLGLSRCMPAP